MLTFKQYLKETFNERHLEKIHGSLVSHYIYDHGDAEHISRFTHGTPSDHGSRSFNSALHRGTPLSFTQAQLRDNLDRIATKHQAPQNLTVYRGMNKGSAGVSTQHNSYTSTSLHPGQALEFATPDKTDGMLHVMKIHVPKGSHGIYAGGYSHSSAGDHESDSFEHEKEFILPRGSKFQTEPNPQIRQLKDGRKMAVWHSRLVHDGTKKV